ncbi:MAG: ImmA/IrrE family metallo-endopeptidase [Desulfatiglandaceae bacterium]
MSKQNIALKAYNLIDSFQAMAGYIVKPPIPVEDIVERYLRLRLIYDDLGRILGTDVLGATYVESRTLCINERLFENGSEGRLVFTCAHEVAHWVLHRPYVRQQKINGPESKSIVCTTSNAKAPIEWQADYFASCLLMPEKEIREAFERVCGPEPFVMKRARSEAGKGTPCEQPYVEQWPFISAAMCEAGGFSNVSKQAMIIRLQDLGLLVNKTPVRLDWNAFA